jgi:hypothetical protein
MKRSTICLGFVAFSKEDPISHRESSCCSGFCNVTHLMSQSLVL